MAQVGRRDEPIEGGGAGQRSAADFSGIQLNLPPLREALRSKASRTAEAPHRQHATDDVMERSWAGFRTTRSGARLRTAIRAAAEPAAGAGGGECPAGAGVERMERRDGPAWRSVHCSWR
jgi:hypothetical protein